jgi:serine/threonine-protein kinase
MPTSIEQSAAPEDVFQLVGQEIEHSLRVEKVVAIGGFAVVYRAYDARMQEHVALKCLRPPRALSQSQAKAYCESFEREARLLRTLQKSNAPVVHVYSAGVHHAPTGDWVPYIVLQWCEGGTLEDHLEALRTQYSQAVAFELAEMMSMMEPVAHALAMAHDYNIVHRDLKPSNLFRVKTLRREELRVGDFGVSKVIDAEQPKAMTAENFSAAFTCQYGAPEQFNRKLFGPTSKRTDVFAFALICVELLTGRVALPGEQQVEFYSAVTRTDVRPTPRTLGANVSDELEAVFARALAVEPATRHADLRELWFALCAASGTELPAWVRSCPPAPGPVSGRAVSLPSPPRMPTDSNSANTVRTERRSKAPLLVALFAGAALMCAGLVFALRPGGGTVDTRGKAFTLTQAGKPVKPVPVPVPVPPPVPVPVPVPPRDAGPARIDACSLPADQRFAFRVRRKLTDDDYGTPRPRIVEDPNDKKAIPLEPLNPSLDDTYHAIRRQDGRWLVEGQFYRYVDCALVEVVQLEQKP